MTPPTYLRIEILRERLRAAPAVDRQAQRLAHADVVEGLARGVEDDHQVVDPGALEHRQVVLHLVQQLGLLGRVAAAELGVELAAEDAGNDGVRLHEVGLVAVEIGLALVEVALEALALPAGAAHVLDQREGRPSP